MPIEHPILRCGFCAVPEKHFPDFDTTGREMGECLDEMVSVATASGWYEMILGYRRMAVCPECAAYWESKRSAPQVTLPAFSPVVPCPKCGGETLMRFCDGLVATCKRGYPDEHMHRTCIQCGFEFFTKVKA